MHLYNLGTLGEQQFKTDCKVAGIEPIDYNDESRIGIDFTRDEWELMHELDIDFATFSGDHLVYHEIKTDSRIAETGNLAYEIESYLVTQGKKTGGMLRSCADYFHIYASSYYMLQPFKYIIDAKRLKEYIDKNNLIQPDNIKIATNSRTTQNKVILIPIKDLIDLGIAVQRQIWKKDSIIF